MNCCLFATLKEVLADNDLWLQNTSRCSTNRTRGREERERRGKKKRKKGEEKRKKKHERERDVKIALKIQSELTSTNEILYLLTLSFYLKQGIQDSTE
jgi:hypothetical protein